MQVQLKLELDFKTTEYDCRTPTDYNVRAALALPSFMCLPFVLMLLGEEFELGIMALASAVIMFFPFNCLMHLLMKPYVLLDQDDIIVELRLLQFRKRCTECKIRRLSNGTYVVRFFPWFADFVPGGMTPSRLRVTPKAKDVEFWDRIYNKSQMAM